MIICEQHNFSQQGDEIDGNPFPYLETLYEVHDYSEWLDHSRL